MMERGASMAPAGGDDCIRTPECLARAIVAHFGPVGRVCDPCRGDGAFANAMPGCDWWEIADGRNFLTCETRYDWIVTNPPWGEKFRPLLVQMMRCADNVVLLANVNVWFTKRRLLDVRGAGFGLREVLCVPTPKPPWPQQGFQLGAMWLQKGWMEGLRFTFLEGE